MVPSMMMVSHAGVSEGLPQPGENRRGEGPMSCSRYLQTSTRS